MIGQEANEDKVKYIKSRCEFYLQFLVKYNKFFFANIVLKFRWNIRSGQSQIIPKNLC